jgi:uncharacterized protein YgiM (DUF1202 family)
MNKRLLVLLLVVALSLVSGLQLSGASGTQLQAVTLAPVTLYVEASETAEVALELPENTVVDVMGTDQSGAWLQVATADGEGYGMAENFMVLSLPAFAPKTVVSTNENTDAGLFAAPDMASEITGTIPAGQIVSILGAEGQWVYVAGPDGSTGWSVNAPFAPVDVAMPALVTLGDAPDLGVFAEANITADIATTVPNGSLLYIVGEADGSFVPVLTSDGTQGYALANSLTALPSTMVDAEVNNAEAGIYVEPSFTADLLGALGNGESLYFMSSVDDAWAEVYAPGLGHGYALKDTLGDVYTVGTVQRDGSNVRASATEASDVVAQLDFGQQVLVVGQNEAGDWYQVVLPFDQVDFPARGLTGWMASWLFENGGTGPDFDPTLLSVTE